MRVDQRIRIRLRGFDYRVLDQSVAEIVDTTGAGDLFAAGFLAGFAQGLPHERSAALGALAAAEVISHFGARPQKDLLQLARDNGLLS